MRLVYSTDAVADLGRLRQFIATHDPDAAARIAAALKTRIEGLCTFPSMGRKVESLPAAEVRDFFFGSYSVRYLVRGDLLVVLRVWHRLEAVTGGAGQRNP